VEAPSAPRDNWDQECTHEMMIIDTPVNPDPNAECCRSIPTRGAAAQDFDWRPLQDRDRLEL